MLRDLTFSAKNNAGAFRGFEYLSLLTEVKRLQTSDWRTQGSLIHFLKGLMWRIVWQGLILIQDIRVNLIK
jgi:hypothetical protein